MVFAKVFGLRRKSLHLPIVIDEHGYRWADKEFFGFGDFSREKDHLPLSYPTAEEYLRRHGDDYPWSPVWLAHGKSFAPPTREECLELDRTGGHIIGNCYNTALSLALHKLSGIARFRAPEDILFVEGMAVHPTGAHLHAWLLVDDRVYDPSWPDAYRATYFGIAFEPEWVLQFAESFGKVSQLQNWPQSQPRLAALFGAQQEPA